MVLDINNIGRRFNNTKYFSANDIVSKPEEILQEMYDFNPVLIDSFPSFLLDYTKAILTYPHLRNPNLRYIITKGENLTITQRKYFEEKLQCEVIDRYGMEEFGPVGTECKERYGFHISMESFLVEIIDEQGKPVPLGETGRIIITDFRNYAMPFIRYDTKDRGHYIKEKCICGRPGHKLLIEGRETEFLYLKDKKINYFEFWEIMRDHSETVLQYQIVHTSDFAVTLLLVPSSKLNTFTHNLIQKKIESLLGPLYKVTIEVVSSIKKTKRGKVKLILNLNP
jgi:phenylacetate-CoA ligase